MTTYKDVFAYNQLPKNEDQPDFIFNQPDFILPDNLNCVTEFIDKNITSGRGDKLAIRNDVIVWTFNDLNEKVNQIANVLVDEMGLVSGNRVLIRGMNNPWFMAIWFAVIKCGGIVVATMPLLKTKDLQVIIDKAEIQLAFCDKRLQNDLQLVESKHLKKIMVYDVEEAHTGELQQLMLTKSIDFKAYKSHKDDIALIAFTSGTTGVPKMTAHYHRDIVLICKGYPKTSLNITPNDISIGTPPLAFTFGLGGLVLFPLFYGAASFLIEKPTPENVLKAIEDYAITMCFTAPTFYRMMTQEVVKYNITSLRKCVSAGENLPAIIWQNWFKATGIKIIDGIGATEMLHIFISANEDTLRVGATGKPVYGYEAKIIDKDGNELPAEQQGFLAVRGITGCRYLNDDRQKKYVRNKWNIIEDVFKRDVDGYFWFIGRSDDMIISSGYNIAAVSVEAVLLKHSLIKECAVVGEADEERGQIVSAYIVLNDLQQASEALKKEIQTWYKQEATPYSYPRKITFVASLPKNPSGKLTRFVLK